MIACTQADYCCASSHAPSLVLACSSAVRSIVCIAALVHCVSFMGIGILLGQLENMCLDLCTRYLLECSQLLMR